MHEAQLHEQNCWITLTYNDEHLPEHNTLRYRDFQLFLKKLRKHAARKFAGGSAPLHPPNSPAIASPQRIRFYVAGEYGDQRLRPHFHACLFGYDFNDKQYFTTTETGGKLYTSETLNKIWAKGHTTIGALTFESAAYTARYIMKKITGQNSSASYEKIDPETGEIINRKPEFNNMSRKPGIGKHWIEKYTTDVYPEGMNVVNGHKSRPPRYYDKYFKTHNLDQYEDMCYRRHLEARDQAQHNTDERLAVREHIAKAKTQLLQRKLR